MEWVVLVGARAEIGPLNHGGISQRSSSAISSAIGASSDSGFAGVLQRGGERWNGYSALCLVSVLATTARTSEQPWTSRYIVDGEWWVGLCALYVTGKSHIAEFGVRSVQIEKWEIRSKRGSERS